MLGLSSDFAGEEIRKKQKNKNSRTIDLLKSREKFIKLC